MLRTMLAQRMQILLRRAGIRRLYPLRRRERSRSWKANALCSRRKATRHKYLKLAASGEVDETLLESLEDYVKRQKKRLGRFRTGKSAGARSQSAGSSWIAEALSDIGDEQE